MNVVKKPAERFFDLKKQVDPSVLDFVHLATYTNGDEGLEGELLGLFEHQAMQLVNSILQTNDENDWKMAVHTLKGGAGGIGARKIEMCCRSLEEAGFVHREENHNHLYAAVEQCVMQIRILTKSR